MSVFVDAGNVFNTYSGQGRDGKFSLGRIRYSAGIGVEWRSPMGPLVFSISTPLGDYHRDKEIFQFTIASTL